MNLRSSWNDVIFMGIIYTILCFSLLAVLYPLLFVVSSSLSSPQAVVTGAVKLWPVEPTWMAYKAVLQSDKIMNGFLNSIMYTVVGTMINVMLTCTAAYPLSRKELYGRNLVMIFITITMFFSGGLIPSYMLVQNLGMMNTLWAMVLPGAIGAWFVIIARTFFQSSIPEELKDAAEIDGCNDYQFIYKIVLPLSMPIIAVMSLMYAVGHWNSYFNALIYLDDQDKFPLQIVLRSILILNNGDSSQMIPADMNDLLTRQYMAEMLKYAIIVVSSAPIILLYPFIQKHFIKGVMMGSLKG